MDLRKLLIAGNWKMNGTLDSISEILKIDKLCDGYEVDVALCVPKTRKAAHNYWESIA